MYLIIERDSEPRADHTLVFRKDSTCTECGHELYAHGMTYWQTGVSRYDVGIRTVGCYDCPPRQRGDKEDVTLCLERATSWSGHIPPEAGHHKSTTAKDWSRSAAAGVSALQYRWNPPPDLLVRAREARFRQALPKETEGTIIGFYDGSTLVIAPDIRGKLRVRSTKPVKADTAN